MASTIALSLVSHTNVGKTTLARTLLGRDVGEVRDAPHVTDSAESWTLVQTSQGDVLQLWDTPGFGDSVRLLRRLKIGDNPLARFLGEAWDRWRDRPFWASQQALRNVREQADVVLYLVNAAESPEAAGYVDPEMDLLAWVGKPVVVLLNQLGPPREAAAEAAEIQRWRDHLGSRAVAVLPLDAFARCWVQEGVLLHTLAQALDGEARAAMDRLRAAWGAERLAIFEAAMNSLAQSLARIAGMREAVPSGLRLLDRLRQVGQKIGLAEVDPDGGPAAAAQRALAGRVAAELQANTAELIRLHGLVGAAQREILERVATQYDLRLRLDEGKAALAGGALTGALAGLKADVLSGGLTLGGGMLAGALIGALGGAGLARGLNLVRGREQSWVSWNADALDQWLEAGLLRYLAVAHFGRGRGEWAQGEAPAHWRPVVAQALSPQRAALAALWRARDPDAPAPAAESELAARLGPLVTAAGEAALKSLYPGAWPGTNDGHNHRA